MLDLLSDKELLKQLVSFDSTSSNSNLPIAEFIADYVSGTGVQIVRIGEADKINLLAFTGPQSAPGSGLILSGHMDTVPAREKEWSTDPFSLAEDEERFYGRGTADMKGFLAVALNAFLRARSRTLTSPLVLLITYDEEVGCLGSRFFAEAWQDRGPLPRSVVIGEPTSLRVARMHKGHLKLRLSISGKGAHSGYPHLGVNAIEKAGPVIEALSTLRETLEQERTPHSEFFHTVPYVPINLGVIQGGTAVNIVPDRCEIEVGIRLLPGMSSETMIGRVRDVVLAAESTTTVEAISDSPPMVLSEESKIYRATTALVGQTSTETISFATDAGWLQKLGLECVVFGPGSIQVAHRPNEFIPKSELARAATLLDRLVEKFCEAREHAPSP